jgi:ATP-binding cassette subfamily B (MDR/TAP) protein 1
MGYKISDFISMIGRGIGCFIYAMISSWKFTIVFLGIMPFISICTAFIIIFAKKYTVKELKGYEIAGKIAQEVLSSIRTVYSFGSMKHEVEKYEKNLSAAEVMSTKKGLVAGIFVGIILGLFNICFAVGLYYATYLARTDCEQFAPGDIVRCLFLMITSTFAVGQAVPFLKDLAESKASAKAVYDIIEKKSEISVFDKADKVRVTNGQGELSFEDVHFSYPQRKEAIILKGLNLRIPAGKTIALCGSSGCGKSTTIQLLQRFYDPTRGVIKFDNVNIADLDVEWFRTQMALVSQEPVLFSATIRY